MMNDVSRPVQAQRFGKWFLICLSVFFLGFTGTASAQAASYVKASKTQVKTTSSTRRGCGKAWQALLFLQYEGTADVWPYQVQGQLLLQLYQRTPCFRLAQKRRPAILLFSQYRDHVPQPLGYQQRQALLF